MSTTTIALSMEEITKFCDRWQITEYEGVICPRFSIFWLKTLSKFETISLLVNHYLGDEN
jgi:hypothetical protein